MRPILVLVLVAAALAGCRGKPVPSPAAKGQAARQGPHPAPRDPVADAAAEAAALKEAQDAVAELVKHVGDCEAVTPAFAAANAKLDVAVRKVRSDAGKAALEALRKQAGQVEGRCE